MKNIYIIGAGITGLTIALECASLGLRTTIIDKRYKIGGNCSTHYQNGIEVHEYGPHIFHTDDLEIWKYITKFSKFNNYTHKVLSEYKGKIYTLPFGLKLFNEFYNTNFNPIQLKKFISEITNRKNVCSNLEECAINSVGKDIYDAFIREYTIKQWGKDPKTLPASIIKRIPIRYNYNYSYYDDIYLGIPLNGYLAMFDKMIDSDLITLRLNYEFTLDDIDDNIFFYTGQLDRLFNFKHGMLSYRSLKFDVSENNIDDMLGTAVINYPELKYKHTRICEFKHFHPETYKNLETTIICKEFSLPYDSDKEAYYPIHSDDNNIIYNKYINELKSMHKNVILCGRLAEFKYFDIDDAIKNAIACVKNNKQMFY